MRKLLLLLLVVLPSLLGAEPAKLPNPDTVAAQEKVVQIALPEKPINRVYDDANIFDLISRDRLSRVLQAESKKYGISVYVATFSTLDKNNPVTIGDLLREAWITQPQGMVILYVRNTDKISISLTQDSFKKLQAKGRVDELANEIDRFNQEGPNRAIPKSVNTILNGLRVAKAEESIFLAPEKAASPLLIYIPLGIILAALATGLWKLYRFLDRQNMFDHAYELDPGKVFTAYGATKGGIQIGIGKFR